MILESATRRIVKCFNNNLFPKPHEFTDLEIEAIAAMPGIDAIGTFADSPLERSLIWKYDLEARYGEHTWPGFAESLREQKTDVLGWRASEDKFAQALAKLESARAEYLGSGLPREEIDERIDRAKLTLNRDWGR